MQTIAPMPIAIGEYMSPVQPSATKSRQGRIKVAIVMPEIGFDDVPIRPVMRDETVAKKKPKIKTRTAARTLPYVGSDGTTMRKSARRSDPPTTTVIGMSRSVRARLALPVPDEMSRKLSRAEATIVGI